MLTRPSSGRFKPSELPRRGARFPHQGATVDLQQTVPSSDAVSAIERAPVLRTAAPCACGGGCPRCNAKTDQFGAMSISQPGDTLEREADAVADRVLSNEVDRLASSPLNLQRATRSAGASGAPAEVTGVPVAQFRIPVVPVAPAGLPPVQCSAVPGGSALAVQLDSDPSPPPDLELDPNAPPVPGGTPIFDDGAVNDVTDAAPEPAQEDVQTAPPVQAASHGTSHGRVAANRVTPGLGGGAPLEPGVRSSMSAFFGHDFSGVSVHTDSRANGLSRSLHAYAFTLGNKIAFANGQYDPGCPEGQRLIAHELTHVLQQRRGLGSDIRRAGMGAPGDRYEAEAERNAERFVRREKSDLEGRSTATPPGEGEALQLYSGSAASTYARTWALGTNPAFPRDGNDCTNFVSQAVSAGGWTPVGGTCDDRKSNTAWWYGDTRCWYPGVHRSYTWGGAQNFFNFVNGSGRATAAAKISDLGIGDVLQVKHGGRVGHTTMVTGRSGSNLLLSYHTNDTLDLPVWGPGNFLDRWSGTTPTYYAWKL